MSGFSHLNEKVILHHSFAPSLFLLPPVQTAQSSGAILSCSSWWASREYCQVHGDGGRQCARGRNGSQWCVAQDSLFITSVLMDIPEVTDFFTSNSLERCNRIGASLLHLANLLYWKSSSPLLQFHSSPGPGKICFLLFHIPVRAAI